MLKARPEDYPPGSAARAQIEAALGRQTAKQAIEPSDETAEASAVPRRQLEDELQRDIIKTADHYPLKLVLDSTKWSRAIRSRTLGFWLFAIPNGGNRNALEAAILKGLGVRAGVWDLFLRLPVIHANGETYGGLWLENKVGTNTLTSSQKAFGEDSRVVGYQTAEIRSVKEFLDACEGYLRGSRALHNVRR